MCPPMCPPLRPPPHRLLPLLTGLALACGEPEPVLQGVPPQALLEQTPSATAQARALQQPEVGQPYVRPEGVLVDVRYLGGRALAAHRDVLGEQLGALVQAVELPGGAGQELQFERGVVRVLDDAMYMVRVPLPEPLRRTDALVLLGFPAQADRYLIFHREYRLNNEFGFRRIRLVRQSPDNELVTAVEAWHQVPGEPGPAR